jgi:hypothetical protein
LVNSIYNVALDIIKNAVDFHVHASPDVAPRIQDMIEVAEDAKRYHMKAIVFKDHYTMTADRSYFVNKIVPEVKCIGTIALNYGVGGFNPVAVEAAAKMGAKCVFMPSIDSAWTIHQVCVEKRAKWLEPLLRIKNPKEGLSVLKGGLEGTEILPEVKEVLSVIKQYNLVLDILHISPKERKLLVDEAKKHGIEKIVLTHPNCSIGFADINEQKELASRGVFMAYAFLPCLPLFDRQSPEVIAEMIKAIGPEKSLLCTDLGQIVNPPPVEGYRLFILQLLACGVPKDWLETMAQKTPAKILDL